MMQCKNRILFHMPVLGIHFQLGLHCYFHFQTYLSSTFFRKKHVVVPELV